MPSICERHMVRSNSAACRITTGSPWPAISVASLARPEVMKRVVSLVLFHSPSLSRSFVPLSRNPMRRCQRCTCPADEPLRIIEQTIRHTPEREVDRHAFLEVAQWRMRLRFCEHHAVLVIDAEIQRVVCDHCEHRSVTEH